MEDIFSKKSNVHIVRLNNKHAKFESDHLNIFKKLVLTNEQMYPGIDKWISNKVLPGLKNEERIAFVGYENEKPIISAVVKRGKKSKFCHLKVSENFQNILLGELFFSLMTFEVRNFAQEIHFTLPESLWYRKNDFFKSFGFREFVKSEIQYRKFEEELKCSAAFKDVWKAVLDRLPKLMYHFSLGGISNENRLLLSIKPKFLNEILSGNKKIELRKKFSKKWLGSNVSLYASSPIQAIMGNAKIKHIEYSTKENIWEKYSNELGVSKKDYDAYTSDASEIYALFLDEISPYEDRITLNHLSYLLNKELKPPQSYCSLEKNQDWRNAISVATILHANLSNITERDIII